MLILSPRTKTGLHGTDTIMQSYYTPKTIGFYGKIWIAKLNKN